MQIPYTAIGTGVALILIALAVYEAESNGRIIILALALITFLLPFLFPSRILNLICYIARMLLGICCYIFLRYRGAIQ